MEIKWTPMQALRHTVCPHCSICYLNNLWSSPYSFSWLQMKKGSKRQPNHRPPIRYHHWTSIWNLTRHSQTQSPLSWPLSPNPHFKSRIKVSAILRIKREKREINRAKREMKHLFSRSRRMLSGQSTKPNKPKAVASDSKDSSRSADASTRTCPTTVTASARSATWAGTICFARKRTRRGNKNWS